MNRTIGAFFFVLTATFFISGCNKSNSDSAHKAPHSVTDETSLARPTVNAGSQAWEDYLSKQGKLHGKDVQGHPFIYMIPAGDDAAAVARRREEAQSITATVGPIVIPGSLLILGGPSAKVSNQFAMEVPSTLKANALKNVVVLIVSDKTQEETLQNLFKPTGATLRIISM